MENEMKRMLIQDLPQTRVIEKKIYSRPLTAILITGIVGIALILTRTFWMVGAGFVVLALAGYFFSPNRLHMEVDSDALILYPASYPDECYRIPYSDVEEWSLRQQWAVGDFLFITTKQNEQLQEAIVNSSAVKAVMDHKLKDREANAILLRKSNEEAKRRKEEKKAARKKTG